MKSISLGLTFGIVASLGGLAQPMVARTVISEVSEDLSPIAPLLILAALVIVSTVANGLQVFILERIGERVVWTLRYRLVGRLLRLRMEEYDRSRLGDLLSKAGADTTLLRSVLTTSIFNAVPSFVTAIGAVCMMIYLDWFLFLTLAIVLLLVAFLLMPVFARIGQATREAQDHVGSMTADLERSLGASRTVKANRMEKYESRRISAHADNALIQGVRVVKLDAIADAGSAAGLQASFLIVLGVGGFRVAAGDLEIGSLIAFILYIMYLAGPIAALITAATQVQKAIAAISRILEVDRMSTELPSDGVFHVRSGTKAQEKLRGSNRRSKLVSSACCSGIEFERVHFGYRSDYQILDGISFSIDSGTSTAIVGPSGAGKTTVLSLLQRFYAPSSGRILIDGVDISCISLDELRAGIGYVEQSAPLLSGTLRENLIYGVRSEVGDGQLFEAIESVGLRETVSRLPSGLDTQVGERGSHLSGGERQRVACARIILQNASLILLDEATAQLDSLNEESVRIALSCFSGKATTLVVAHRLSTVVDCDQIVVIDDGRVRACGTHWDLIKTDLLYRELAQRQFIT